MRTLILGLLASVGLAVPAMADHTHRGHGHQYHALDQAGHRHVSASGGTIVVQCFRGPWVETIWDRPTAVFLDSLVAVGYDYATAHAIAFRICKDVNLVGDLGALRAEMERIVAESPRYRRR
ncbi:hypothetical protein [Rubellimicrobium sp. CFH 75288]|uniref:hypothetical protein n=1 Tax=Rubellimicrobium sp. CFH 75288 TaxID=2697034 RepID=UPI001411CCC3|nr:hypothetical protein [Rubellimicrobium sp. CFH 75288]NAZ36108.1 hypothetical protein [Rubellimicrobium sp. CFH 75288]